jgi:cellulose synthase/poly-beta-1,6-N-acetylglucosamine synthase-like glycosyltransferase
VPPLLTVFTPIFRTNFRYFEETVVSVLSQSFADFEFLIVNDGSLEDARRIEETFGDPRIRIITNAKPAGLSGSRNQGLNEARGELIAFIDSDDFCEPDRFRRQVDFLRAHPDHVLIGSALRYVDERSQTIGGRSYPETDEDIKTRIVAINCIAQPSVMARRQALLDAGGYQADFPFAEDYALWLRLARFGKFHNFPEALVAYRIHLDSGKLVHLEPALRDSTRLKIHAVRHLGFPLTPRTLASIAVHVILRMLPSPFVYWLFKRLFVRHA